jgi:chromosome segregation ATPase
MSTPFDLNGGLKLCDEQGRTVAVVLANRAFEDLTAETNRLREEAARFQAETAELQRALDAAREELKDMAAITAERDMYLKSLHGMTREDWTFTQEEIADLEKNGVEFNEQFIEELERDLRVQGSSDA